MWVNEFLTKLDNNMDVPVHLRAEGAEINRHVATALGKQPGAPTG